jgi:hypothetical protein
MQLIQPSIYIPRKDTPPVEPAWKNFDPFKKVARRGRSTAI